MEIGGISQSAKSYVTQLGMPTREAKVSESGPSSTYQAPGMSDADFFEDSNMIAYESFGDRILAEMLGDKAIDISA